MLVSVRTIADVVNGWPIFTSPIDPSGGNSGTEMTFSRITGTSGVLRMWQFVSRICMK